MSPKPLDLPTPTPTELTRPPLKFVVAQVRHEHKLLAADPQVALTISIAMEKIMGESLALEQQTAQDFSVGPTGIVPLTGEPQQLGWRLRSASQSWVVALLPEFFALESTGYTSWTEFRRRFDALCQVVAETLKPALSMRMGLRYIDQLAVPGITSPHGWNGYVDAGLLGPLAHPQLGPSVQTLQQVVTFQGPAGLQVILRHGTQPDGDQWPYMFDTDCYSGDTQPFDVAQLLKTADALHQLGLQVFQSALTPQLVAYLAGGEL